MELEIMYPEIIFLAIFITAISVFLKKKDNKFKEGIIVANTKYVKKTEYYKKILIKYRIYNVLIKIMCFMLVCLVAFLTSRYYEVKNIGEEINNRDIMLCMDVSESVTKLNRNLINSIKDTVSKLRDERIGIIAFDSMPLTIVPLTTDYKYVLSSLDQIDKALNTKYNPFKEQSNSFVRDFLYAGVKGNENTKRGSSLVGDGLSYCASSFKDNNRTKIIILTTDNEVIGKELITTSEAGLYCKQNNIMVFSIGTEDINNDNKEKLKIISQETDAEYYDFKDYSTSEIVNKINSTNKNAIVKTETTYIRDFPEKIIPYILIIIPILFILEWRIRI